MHEDLVETILQLTGWTQVRLVHELRQTAKALGEPEPIGLDAVTVNRWRWRRQRPGTYYVRLLRHLHASLSRTGPPIGWRPRPTRRQLLTYSAAMAGYGLAGLERLSEALQAGAQPDPRLVDELETGTIAYARLWSSVRPADLVAVMRHHVAAVNELRARAGGTSASMTHLAAETTAIVGWLQWLAGDRETAEAYCLLAQAMAGEIEDSAVIAFVLVVQSFMHSRLFDTTSTTTSTALAMLDHAVATASMSRSPFLKAFALNRRAEEHALIGGKEGALAAGRDLDGAETALAAAVDRDPGFFHYLDSDRLLGTRGTCAALLSNSREAIETLSDVLARTRPEVATERSILVTDLAAAYAQSGEPEHACVLLSESLALGRVLRASQDERVAPLVMNAFGTVNGHTTLSA